MTKADIVDVISKGTGLTKLETGAVVDGFLETVSYALRTGEKVELRGFGTFCLRERQEKHIANPKTGKEMVIPHRIVPDFKPSSQFKRAVANELKSSGKFVSETNQQEERARFFTEMEDLFGDPLEDE